MQETMKRELYELINIIVQCETVRAIGLCREASFEMYMWDEIELFLYCIEIPPVTERSQLYASGGVQEVRALKAFKTNSSGVRDCVLLSGRDVWLNYLILEDEFTGLADIVSCRRTEAEGHPFATGRCAAIRDMIVLYDANGFLRNFKEIVAVYPNSLAVTSYYYHMRQLDDKEDLELAVKQRDVFLFHSAVDSALEHYLKAVFALNKAYFPGRKRSVPMLSCFANVPRLCGMRLLDVIRLGVREETMKKSFEIWESLVEDLKRIEYLR